MREEKSTRRKQRERSMSGQVKVKVKVNFVKSKLNID